jgi:hypothetical protein
MTIEAAAQLCSSHRVFVVGSAADAVVAEAALVGRTLHRIDAALEPGLLEPDARQLLAWAGSSEVPRDVVSPIYLRAPDAKPQQGKAIPRRPSDGHAP